VTSVRFASRRGADAGGVDASTRPGNPVLAPNDDFNGKITLALHGDGQCRRSRTWPSSRSTFAPVNDLPVAGDDEGAGSLGAPLVLRIADLLANDDDPRDFDDIGTRRRRS
jgi:hypothetical protein